MDTRLPPERIAEIDNAERAAEELAYYGQTEVRGLTCGDKLEAHEIGSSCLVRCKPENRVISTSRGV